MRVPRTRFIQLLKSCKSMFHLKQIQAQVFTLGIHENIDMLHKLVAFTSQTNLNHAKRIFARLESPSLFVCNVMIKGCVRAGCSEDALYVFDGMRARGLCPDNYTYPFVFKAIGGLRMVNEGEKVHGFVVKCGDLRDCYVCNSVLDMYGELGLVENLHKMFDEMTLKDLVSWNVMISALVKNDRFENAIDVYKMMRLAKNVQPDEATIVSTLTACGALKVLHVGHEVYQYVTREIGFTLRIGNALVDMFAKCGCLDLARRIFDGMVEKNVICCTSLVSGYVSAGHLDEARMLFDTSPIRDLHLWTSMINGYVQFNKVSEAMALFRDMQMSGIKPDKYTLVALLTGCSQVGALEEGHWIHAYIEENRIGIDAVVGTALIEMYAKCGSLDMSLRIFYGLKEKDTAAWTSVICAHAVNGYPAKALQLFSEMTSRGMKPDDITFIGVLSACSHGGLVKEGRWHFDSMKKTYQIEPKVEHYGCFVDLLARAGLLREAEDLIGKVSSKDWKMVVPLYGALLSACRNYEEINMGERVAKRLAEIESSGDSSGHTLMASIYAAVERWDDASEVRRKMNVLGAKKKSPGCSVL